MKTLSNNLWFSPFYLLIAVTFCFAGCGSPAQEPVAPPQSDGGVIEMEIETPDSASSSTKETSKDAGSGAKGESGGDSSNEEAEDSSGLSLNPPKSPGS